MVTFRKRWSLETWEYVYWLVTLGTQPSGSCFHVPALTAASLRGSFGGDSRACSAQHLGFFCTAWPFLCRGLLQVCRLREAHLRSVLVRRRSFAMTWPSNDANPASLCLTKCQLSIHIKWQGFCPATSAAAVSALMSSFHLSLLCKRAIPDLITWSQGWGDGAFPNSSHSRALDKT